MSLRMRTVCAHVELIAFYTAEFHRKCHSQLGEFQHVFKAEFIRDVNTAKIYLLTMSISTKPH